ncbi:MAG TPA: hypothetical protein VHE08_00045 [Solirubrobacterales bacterium]|nr:hypothetical protein [Solirubrobacterales bacterium]
MKAHKLLIPLVVALACVGIGVAGTSAASPHEQASRRHRRAKKLRIDSLVVAGKTGPLSITVRAGIRSQVVATVDGRRVDHPFELAGRRAQSLELATSDGLRAGPNKLRITAREDGVVSRATRVVHVPAWALDADAGEDTHTIAHVPTRVGLRPSPRAGGGGEVHYDWRIVDRPPGAKVTLRERDVARPVLHARQPGRYLLQQTADPEGDGEPSSHDRVTVSVVPEDPPIGVPLNTLDAQEDNAIRIAGKSYGGGSGVISYVVLERTTRAVVASGTVANGYDSSGIETLIGLAEKYGSGGNYMRYMMILSGATGIPNQKLADFATLLKKVGTALPSQEEFEAVRTRRPFSVIGIPGAPAGAATTRIPDGPASGAIVGYLTKNQAIDAEGTPLYDFSPGEQPTFDTRLPDSDSTTNKMRIDGQTYSATLLPGATAGLHVVVLESTTLGLLSNEAIATNGLGHDRTTQAEAATKLLGAIKKSDDPTVFVQTIGKPKAAGPEWAGVVEALGRLGANRQLVNALDGTTEYALVAREGATAPPAESSTAYDHGPYPAPHRPPARLVGTLARDRTSSFVPDVYSTPTEASPEGSVNLELMTIAYQPAEAWPELAPGFDRDEVAAAQRYICEELNFCRPTNSCPSVRECFWQRYYADWDAKLAKIGNLTYPKGKGFEEDAFTEVKGELLKEIEAVANVKNYLKELQQPFESGTRSYVDLKAISDKIWQSLQQPAQSNSTSWILGLVGKAVAIGGFAGPPVSGAAAGLAAAFGLASYLSNKQGQPILGAEVRAKSDALAGEMLDRIDAARKTMNGLGMLIVSDHGKLMAAYRHVDSDWALPSPEVADNTLRTASKQWFWEALIPTAFPYLIRADSDNARNLTCNDLGSDRHAWPNQPDFFQMDATVGYRENGTPIDAVFFFTRGLGGAMSPSAQIGDEMFRPRTGTADPGLGMEKLQFFTPRVFNRRIYHALNFTHLCWLGFLPREW